MFSSFAKTIQTSLISENFTDKNYVIKGYQLAPKISYLLSKNTSWDLFFGLLNKENTIGNIETLNQTKFGSSFIYSNDKKITMNGEISLYQNKFNGNEFSSVGFQMLEGLQAGQNIT